MDEYERELLGTDGKYVVYSKANNYRKITIELPKLPQNHRKQGLGSREQNIFILPWRQTEADRETDRERE
jgi:hypothetical protein